MTTATATGFAPSRLPVAACLYCLAALLCALAPAAAATYAYDDGIWAGAVYYDGSCFANQFTVSNIPQTVGTVRVRQSEVSAGVADFCIWAANPANNNLPGTVLGRVEDVAVPIGTAWTTVDFHSLAINLTGGQKIYAGFVNGDSNSVEAQFDAAGTGHSYRKYGTGAWQPSASGDLMLRLTTLQDPSPSAPTTVSAGPSNATMGDKLKGSASGSVPAEPTDIITYQYQWARCPENGSWTDFSINGQYVLPARLQLGDRWKVRARATVPGYEGAWIESAPITIRPLLYRTMPADGAVNAQRRGYVQVNFRWPMVQSSVSTRFALTPAGGSAVAGSFSWPKTGLILRFTPAQPLAQNTLYTLTLGAGVLRRGPLRVNVPTSVQFTTGGMPVPLAWSPTGSSVATSSKVTVTFDKPVGADTVTAASFKLSPVTPGTFAVASNRVTFTPTSALQAGRRYGVWLSGQIATPTGRIMGRSFSWSFTTASAAPALVATAAAAPAAGGVTAITVNLNAAASVTVEITNLSGRVVAALPLRDLPEGLSTLAWDGSSGHGTKVPAGRYFARLSVRDGSGAVVHCQAPLMR